MFEMNFRQQLKQFADVITGKDLSRQDELRALLLNRPKPCACGCGRELRPEQVRNRIRFATPHCWQKQNAKNRMKPKKLTAALAALMLCLSLHAVIVLPPQVPVVNVFTVQTFWANGTNNDMGAVLAILPSSAPDYVAATSAGTNQIVISTNLVFLGTNSSWYVNSNGVNELDFAVTNPPNGLLSVYPQGSGYLTNLPPSVPVNFYNALTPDSAVTK